MKLAQKVAIVLAAIAAAFVAATIPAAAADSTDNYNTPIVSPDNFNSP
jgi:hypothetical protein